MPTYRVTFGLVGQDGGTWNEVYYQDASAIATAGPSVKTINARIKLLHNLNQFRSIRIVDVDAARVTRNILVNLNGKAGGIDDGPAPNDNAAVFSLVSPQGGSRKLWLRGVPQSFIKKNATTGKDIFINTFDVPWGFYLTQLKVDGFGVRTLQGITPGPLSPLKILKVDGTAADGTSLVTLAAAPGYPFPARVLIGGASKKDLPALNGQFSLVAAPAGAVVRIPYATPANGMVNGGNAHMRQAIYNPTHVFDDSQPGFDHFGGHATRTQNFRSRGARRAQRLRTVS